MRINKTVVGPLGADTARASKLLASFADASKLKNCTQREHCEGELLIEFFPDDDNRDIKTKQLAISMGQICRKRQRVVLSICRALLRSGRFEEARILCSISLSGPGSAQRYQLAGEIEHSLGNIQEAEAHWKTAVACDPEHIPSIDSLRSLYSKRGNTEQLRECEDQLSQATAGLILSEDDLRALIVHHPWLPLKRLGPAHDGGYVLMQQSGSYDLLLAGGAGANTLFEKDFCKHYAVDGHIFDPTVDRLPDECSRLKFHKLAICNVNSSSSTNLSTYLRDYRNVFVKMDVEGAEFAWIESISSEAVEHIKQIVVEFHGPFTKRRLRAIAGLTTTHALVHVHANNYARNQRVGSSAVPLLLEATFVRKDSHVSLKTNTMPFPTRLDYPNIPDRPDTELNFWPFVSSESNLQ